MQKEVQKIISDFLSEKIDREAFVNSCGEIYMRAINPSQNMFKLDAIKIIPLVHELSRGFYTDEELKNQARSFQLILERQQEYYYSTFVRVGFLDKEEQRFKDSSIELSELYKVFTKYINSPQTIQDLLCNSIYDILSKWDLTCCDENDFSSINCHKDISFEQIERRIRSLLAYLKGEEAFLLQIHYSLDGNDIYVIS